MFECITIVICNYKCILDMAQSITEYSQLQDISQNDMSTRVQMNQLHIPNTGIRSDIGHAEMASNMASLGSVFTKPGLNPPAIPQNGSYYMGHPRLGIQRSEDPNQPHRT